MPPNTMTATVVAGTKYRADRSVPRVIGPSTLRLVTRTRALGLVTGEHRRS